MHVAHIIFPLMHVFDASIVYCMHHAYIVGIKTKTLKTTSRISSRTVCNLDIAQSPSSLWGLNSGNSEDESAEQNKFDE